MINIKEFILIGSAIRTKEKSDIKNGNRQLARKIIAMITLGKMRDETSNEIIDKLYMESMLQFPKQFRQAL